ncbi:MAG: hypothetical protein J7623_06890 [Chitinophaga sp.]|uniref:hypothetical protein n=1 Tax=Chitinophaga sp. TaxID=1869181 RepID=UPI001B0C3C0D|nr:hypothetical protein [Chitinophaga sp.]MBO9728349.1 hypothetical protein [Chitinophaga sp.]
MYPAILALHSLVRWLLLASLIFAIYRAWRGWLSGKTFSSFDHTIRRWTIIFAHIQFLVGLYLYFISPLISYFWAHFKEAVHQREIRFFGMEHSLMMMIAVVVLTIGAAKSRRQSSDTAKFKTMAIWFSIALFIILTSIPWAFSPLTHRPWFRGF